jgi:predicted peptidase
MKERITENEKKIKEKKRVDKKAGNEKEDQNIVTKSSFQDIKLNHFSNGHYLPFYGQYSPDVFSSQCKYYRSLS